ncbi:MAG: penicillin-insensitive murein endopeptidase [Myxococcales bacterium]|nr:penicillin-insensitive murein endopeptidase [Myxococcales bacterium]
MALSSQRAASRPPRAPALVLLLLWSLCAVTPAVAERERSRRARDSDSDTDAAQSQASKLRPLTETHRVAAGETLSEIAADYGISLADLLAHNPDINPDRIAVGQEIALGGDRRRIDYRVRDGETLTGIARRYEVSLAEVARWNPGLEPDRIRAGQTLLLYAKRPRSDSHSVGAPDRGHLEAGRPLPRHRGYEIRERGRAFGTDEAVRGIVSAFDHLAKRHPQAPKLRIHDLSLKKGGRMRDHRSHQSGRDADLAYFKRSCPAGVCGFGRFLPRELDAARTWTLLEYWLERDMLEAVFIDYRLQPALYREARSRGASRDELHRWFQYPSGRGHPVGIVRHFPKHADHMHVRFACHHTDAKCESFRPLLDRRREAAARAELKQ